MSWSYPNHHRKSLRIYYHPARPIRANMPLSSPLRRLMLMARVLYFSSHINPAQKKRGIQSGQYRKGYSKEAIMAVDYACRHSCNTGLDRTGGASKRVIDYIRRGRRTPAAAHSSRDSRSGIAHSAWHAHRSQYSCARQPNSSRPQAHRPAHRSFLQYVIQ
jgi:hypothetical protein